MHPRCDMPLRTCELVLASLWMSLAAFTSSSHAGQEKEGRGTPPVPALGGALAVTRTGESPAAVAAERVSEGGRALRASNAVRDFSATFTPDGVRIRALSNVDAAPLEL